MREIKFRAFVKRLNIIVDVVSIDFTNKYITWYDGQFSRSLPPELEYEIESFETVEFMQYTGLKDKNGKEIYEGDIVCLKENRIGIVKYGYNEVSFIIESDGLNLYMHGDVEYEILGNIYENKDLIKGDI